MQPQFSNYHDHPAGHVPRILVVDDEASFTRLLKINLESTGRYIVQVENDPNLALPAAIDFHPDLVLLDVMMPDLDGGDVANRLMNDARFEGLTVIFLTATVKHAEVDAYDGCIGGFRFLSKPVSLPELLACLDSHFTGSRQHA